MRIIVVIIEKKKDMRKHWKFIMMLLLLFMFRAGAQEYSPCYINNMSKGNTAYNQGRYSEARTYYVDAKRCAGGDPTVAQQKISACDAKLKEQRDAEKLAEEKRRAEQEAEEVKRKAEEEAKKRPKFTVNSVIFNMILVNGDTFKMGNNEGGENDKPEHYVTLSDFYIAETEVTQALWNAVMGLDLEVSGRWTDEYDHGSDYPAYRLSWIECHQFCEELNNKLSGQLPLGYRFALPTEAQWEFAARGGSMGHGYKYSGGNTVKELAWYDGNSGGKMHPVKNKQANELGLYDMSGNVREWCLDWTGDYSDAAQTDPQGPSSGTFRVLRGGCWSSSAWYCRVTYRYDGVPEDRVINYGFRLALVRQ